MKIKIRSIKTQLSVILLVVMSAAFSLLSFIASERLKALPEIILDQYQEIAVARAYELGNEIQGLSNQIQMISLSSTAKSMVLEDIQTMLLSMSRQERFRNFTFSNDQGIAWASYNQFIDISNQDQFKEIFLNKKSSYLSNPFFSPFIPEPFPIITISHAIQNEEGHNVGLINGVVSTVFIDNLLSSITFQQDGFAWIVDKHGVVVAHPNPEITITSTFNQITALNPTILDELDSRIFNYQENGINFINVVADIPNTNGWRLILSIDEAQAFAKANELTNTINASLFASLLVLLFILLLTTNAIITPILNLQNAFDEAKKGNLNVKADETTPNEIGEAAKSFNQMLVKIKELTYIDPITGLNNLFSFLSEMGQINHKTVLHDQHAYVVILSIDDFKRINSIYGYDIGNDTLKALSGLIQPHLKKYEMVARYFGDEMICSLYSRSELEIRQRVENIVALARQPITVSGIDIHLDISCGVARFEEASTLSLTIRQATLAKHKAKSDPYTHVIFYSQSIYLEMLSKQDLEEAITLAIENEEFYLLYQPIYHMGESRIKGYEALLRWNHPKYSIVPIIEVIRLAESKGLIQDIGRFVFLEAATKLKALNEHDPTLSIAVNLSPIQLQNHLFVENAMQTLSHIKFNPHNLIIEITEGATVLDSEDKQDILNRLKSLGFRIAIDDFGSGYSSLLYITKLPVDTIKIDRDFIQKIECDDFSRVLVVSIISIAKTLNLSVIAEGVETQEQAEALQKLGCELIQGYYISKPKPL
jgi:diguanylate cyclase (GGDEF)-like protein